MKLIVIGAGPIGGIIGGLLARAGYDVTLVDVDAEHVYSIRRRGLQVDVPDGSFHVSVPALFPGEITGKFDIGLIAVRSNYTRDALASVVPYLNQEGILVSLQNGMNPPLLEEAVGPDRAIGAVVRMRSLKLGSGHVGTEARGRLFIGHLQGKTTPGLKKVHSLLDAVIPTRVTDNIHGLLWSKLSYTCLGMLGSLAQGSLKSICEIQENRRLFIYLLGEVTGVGTAGGVHFEPLAEYHPMAFHPSCPFESRMASFEKATTENWQSYDRETSPHPLKAGVRTHVEYTVGYVIREGDRVAVPTPLCRSLASMIHEVEEGKRSLGMQNFADLA